VRERGALKVDSAAVGLKGSRTRGA
jgi:hypothetical protein